MSSDLQIIPILRLSIFELNGNSKLFEFYNMHIMIKWKRIMTQGNNSNVYFHLPLMFTQEPLVYSPEILSNPFSWIYLCLKNSEKLRVRFTLGLKHGVHQVIKENDKTISRMIHLYASFPRKESFLLQHSQQHDNWINSFRHLKVFKFKLYNINSLNKSIKI